MARRAKIQPPHLLITLALIYFLVLILWLIYRVITSYSEVLDELIFKPIIWLAPVVMASSYYRINISVLLRKPKISLIHLSILSGIGLALTQIIPQMIRGSQVLNISFIYIFTQTIITIGTAFTEEVLFRGLLLKQSGKYFPPVMSNIAISILFVIIHLPLFIFVKHYPMQEAYIGSLELFISSLVYGGLFQAGNNLWPAIVTHYINNILLSIL
ncbi:hypothetical protein A2960_05270 [Candidatus Gottesmanbacteria bacterium RIFCSPLOWO2_01_FULL_39_12b]|uniref:CAAX prenyl protease 2/Lysostaphin resistance protein A-like domain-containing protein n=1 Tax=Candidatus Gottesmanbacteria bacterium RIFCSPLOWO2_01_FULL_39_12b TaxID=1798388 RepID=A0A1F6AM19_9BACT|nr:MAG: hypothetical protein A2960_05270 [Candidatus Gottesmanbacteria bacterium RIFCSPLOWO2_01_FULL_39_12b]